MKDEILIHCTSFKTGKSFNQFETRPVEAWVSFVFRSLVSHRTDVVPTPRTGPGWDWENRKRTTTPTPTKYVSKDRRRQKPWTKIPNGFCHSSTVPTDRVVSRGPRGKTLPGRGKRRVRLHVDRNQRRLTSY